MVNISGKIKREAGLLLLGGVIFGSASMLKAAEKYVDDPKQQAIQCYDVFCQEVGNEIERRRNNPEYADKMYMIDRMLEDTLFPQGYDTTIQYQDDVEDFVTDIFKDALRNTLDQSDWYRDMKNDLESDIRGSLSLPPVPEEEPAGSDEHAGRGSDFFGLFGKREEGPARSNDEGRGNGFLGYGGVDTGIHTSLSGKEPRLSAYAKLKGINLFGAQFENGKIEAGTRNNGRLRAYLENAISDQIRYRFDIKAEDIQDPRVDVSLGLTGNIVDGRWEVRAGYRDRISRDDGGEAYATVGLVKLF